jgi:hypothetical protein
MSKVLAWQLLLLLLQKQHFNQAFLPKPNKLADTAFSMQAC